jgi:hypothetical protein
MVETALVQIDKDHSDWEGKDAGDNQAKTLEDCSVVALAAAADMTVGIEAEPTAD